MNPLDPLILKGEPVVRHFVRKWAGHLSKPCERDQMESDAYLALLTAAGKYTPDKGNFFTFAGLYVNSACIDCLRSVNHTRSKTRPVFEPIDDDRCGAWDGGMHAVEVRDTVARCLRAIKGRQAEAVRRYFFDGMTLNEVGREMGIGKGAVSYHLENAYRRMREVAVADALRPQPPLLQAAWVESSTTRSLRLVSRRISLK